MSFAGAVKREVRAFFAQLAPTPVLVFVTAGIALWAYDYYGSLHFFDHPLKDWLKLSYAQAEPISYFYWYGCSFLMLILLPFAIVSLAPRISPRFERVSSLGIGLGDRRVGFAAFGIFYGVMLAILLVLVLVVPRVAPGVDLGFNDSYPLYENADSSLRMFVAYEAAYALYFVAWEFFFRGFLTLGLEKTLGIWTIFAQMLPFVCMHFGKPDLEAFSSIFGGIALGYLAVRTRSFWYGVFIHAATAVSLDVLVVLVKHHVL